jgi:hypothetical protein
MLLKLVFSVIRLSFEAAMSSDLEQFAESFSSEEELRITIKPSVMLPLKARR